MRRARPLAPRPTLALGLALSLALSWPGRAAAGPWAPRPGHGYVKLWAKYLYGFGYHAGDGSTYGYGAYHEAFLAAYAEVGLVDRVALVFHSDIVRTFHLEDPRNGRYSSHLSPGDPALSVRWQFLALGRFVAAAELGVRAPFARPGPVAPVYATETGNPQVGALRIGAGVWDVPARLAAGYAWDRFYVAGAAGYVLRTGGYDHVLTWSAEGGVTLGRDFALRARVVGYHSLDVWIGDRAPGHESPSGIGNGTTYLGFALEGDYQFRPDWFVGFTAEGGAGVLSRQTGGPVVTAYLAARF
jgi:hypothetical protein